MDWERLLSYQRVKGGHTEQFDYARSPFNVDFDRIIFSDAFRRLDEKTQVHPLRNNDNVHSRLSHSLEVASVGRSLGTLAGGFLKERSLLPDIFTPDHTGQIVQTACLAHDIGNPPFGHTGEEIIQNWFKDDKHIKYLESMKSNQITDFTAFEGNAQAFRIVTRLGMYKNEGGIRPTYAVIASMMKYPWVHRDGIKKFCCFSDDLSTLEDIAQKTGLMGKDGIYQRHPLAYLSEAADDICYSIIDIEDAYELNLISYEEAYDTLNGICGVKAEKLASKTRKESIAYLRAVAIGKCVEAVITEFKDRYEEMIEGRLHYKHNLLENSAVKDAIAEAKKLGSGKIYINPRKIMLEVGAENIYDILLSNFCKGAFDKAVNNGGGFRTRGVMNLMGDGAVQEGESVFTAMHKVVDYITGMTDSYAAETAKLMRGIA